MVHYLTTISCAICPKEFLISKNTNEKYINEKQIRNTAKEIGWGIFIDGVDLCPECFLKHKSKI